MASTAWLSGVSFCDFAWESVSAQVTHLLGDNSAPGMGITGMDKPVFLPSRINVSSILREVTVKGERPTFSRKCDYRIVAVEEECTGGCGGCRGGTVHSWGVRRGSQEEMVPTSALEDEQERGEG